MLIRIATVGVATAMALCCLQPVAYAEDPIEELLTTQVATGTTVGVVVGTGDGVEDICAQITTTGLVDAMLGRCEPSPLDTDVLQGGVGDPDILRVDYLLQLP